MMEAATPTTTPRDELFAALVDRHATFLYRVAFSLLKNPQDAEDAVQDTLLKLYRHDAWRDLIDERAFLARSVWRVGLDRLALASAKAMKHAADVTELDLHANTHTPEELFQQHEQKTLLRTLIDQLPLTLRQPLLLSAIEGIRGAELAIILGIPEPTVRTRIHRARTELRSRFLAATEVAR